MVHEVVLEYFTTYYILIPTSTIWSAFNIYIQVEISLKWSTNNIEDFYFNHTKKQTIFYVQTVTDSANFKLSL